MKMNQFVIEFVSNNKGNDVSFQVAKWFSARADRWEAPAPVTLDTQRIMKLSTQGITEKDAQALAFLLWRARMVQRHVRYAAGDAGQPMSWGEAVWHGWQKSELFHTANNERKARIAENEARRERLDAIVQTGVAETEHDAKAAKAALKQQAKEAREAKAKVA